jgi:ABC-type proline/glycine betaine transport system permease subunit
MATYTPTQLRTPTAITASAVTVYTAPASTTGIIRTFSFQTITAHSVSLSIGADAVGTRILDGYLLTINVPYIVNGWFAIPTTVIAQVKADSIATNAPVFGAWGYEFA